jgi:hypothetical protein
LQILDAGGNENWPAKNEFPGPVAVMSAGPIYFLHDRLLLDLNEVGEPFLGKIARDKPSAAHGHGLQAAFCHFSVGRGATDVIFVAEVSDAQGSLVTAFTFALNRRTAALMTV